MSFAEDMGWDSFDIEDMRREADEASYENGYHTSKNGRVKISDMSGQHLNACLNWFDGRWQKKYFLKELNRRNKLKTDIVKF